MRDWIPLYVAARRVLADIKAKMAAQDAKP